MLGEDTDVQHLHALSYASLHLHPNKSVNAKCFPEFCDHSSKLIKHEEGVVGIPPYSQLVRSTGQTTWSLQLTSEESG